MIKRELAIFLVVGILTVIVDFVTYRGLVWLGVMEVDMAKGAGFLTGTVFAYFANRHWTFGSKSSVASSAWRFVILYACTLGANVLVNAFALKVFTGFSVAVQLAFLMATGVSACLNFIGMKLFVFRPVTTSEAK